MARKKMAKSKLPEREESKEIEEQGLFVEQDRPETQMADEVEKPKLTLQQEKELFEKRQQLQDEKILNKGHTQAFNGYWIGQKAIQSGDTEKLTEELTAQRLNESAEEYQAQQTEKSTDLQTAEETEGPTSQQTAEQASGSTIQQNAKKSVGTNIDQMLASKNVSTEYSETFLGSADETSLIYVVTIGKPTIVDSAHATIASARVRFGKIKQHKQPAFMQIKKIHLQGGNTTIIESLHAKDVGMAKELFENGFLSNIPKPKKVVVEEYPEFWAKPEDEASLDIDPAVPKKLKPRKVAAARNSKTTKATATRGKKGKKALSKVIEDDSNVDDEYEDEAFEQADRDEIDDEEIETFYKPMEDAESQKDDEGEENDEAGEDRNESEGGEVKPSKKPAATSSEIKAPAQRSESTEKPLSKPRSTTNPKSAAELSKDREYYANIPTNFSTLLSGSGTALSGKTIVIGGVNNILTRKLTEDLVRQYGGKVTRVITGKTNYLVLGKQRGTKMSERAKMKKVPILDELALVALLEAANPATDSDDGIDGDDVASPATDVDGANGSDTADLAAGIDPENPVIISDTASSSDSDTTDSEGTDGDDSAEDIQPIGKRPVRYAADVDAHSDGADGDDAEEEIQPARKRAPRLAAGVEAYGGGGGAEEDIRPARKRAARSTAVIQNAYDGNTEEDIRPARKRAARSTAVIQNAYDGSTEEDIRPARKRAARPAARPTARPAASIDTYAGAAEENIPPARQKRTVRLAPVVNNGNDGVAEENIQPTRKRTARPAHAINSKYSGITSGESSDSEEDIHPIPKRLRMGHPEYTGYATYSKET